MYIINDVEKLSIPTFKCRKCIADYLIRNGAPLLSRKDATFFFSDTEKVRELIENAPWWVKVVINNGFNF